MPNWNEIIVLFDGFSEVKKTSENGEIMLANCTCTLIKSQGVNIIIDTLTSWDSSKLLAALEKHNITPRDINFVVSTHGHSDHVGNNNLFLEAEKHIVGLSISKGETYFLHDWTDPFVINEDIKIIPTPGHTKECISVVVKGSNLGETVVIAGDLFERKEDILDDQLWRDAGSFCEATQRRSRAKVASIADTIIPGHGPAFAVTPEMRKSLQEQFGS
ncbi:metallo-beta-lactamase domain-containing protein 1 [Lutzomyia longipalpis]|uniref:metallo-beta-lactamase domain-containing protein 1 n=1 Tax=Lutzomyia longipalpis TaxID=7200 RepID=UPI0024837E67|nr:metallo-beta-lactamase domain-containing protein 1 [Lutzomyia longipalpis]